MAVLDEDVEGAHLLLDRRRRVEAVDLIEVDVVELEPLEARLAGVDQVQARGALGVRARPHRPVALGGDDDAVARDLEVAQGLAGDLLREPLRVDVGRVDEVDPASSARPTRRPASVWSRAPIWRHIPAPPPKVMVPRQSSETNSPVLPSFF